MSRYILKTKASAVSRNAVASSSSGNGPASVVAAEGDRRMSEYSVSTLRQRRERQAEPFPVDGRCLSNLQIGPLPQSEAQTTRVAMLPQDVSRSPSLPLLPADFSTISRCESCIDRIFSLGPEPCPVCHQTLRKAHFTAQSFEDLNVQKEVVIRQRIAKWSAVSQSLSISAD